MDWAKTMARPGEKNLSFEFGVAYIRDMMVFQINYDAVTATTDPVMR